MFYSSFAEISDTIPPSVSGVVCINSNALVENYLTLKAQAPHSICAAVVKADAYGLGAASVAPLLERAGCRHFFVAHLEEGIKLRTVLQADSRIYILNGLLAGTEPQYVAHNLVPVLNSRHQFYLWKNFSASRHEALPSVLQIDSGMNRFGLSREDILSILHEKDWAQTINIVLVMSHLSSASRRTHEANTAQLHHFLELCAILPPSIPKSLAAGSGIFLGPEWQYDMIRPGAALYGVNPTPDQLNPMKNVLTLMGRILQIRHVTAHQSIGYDETYTCQTPTTIAIIGIGYADGFLRSLSNRGHAIDFRHPNIALPIRGRISMDCLCVDISALEPKTLQEGDWLELIGPHIPLDKVAGQAGTIGYEILTALGRRYHRYYTPLTII